MIRVWVRVRIWDRVRVTLMMILVRVTHGARARCDFDDVNI